MSASRLFHSISLLFWVVILSGCSAVAISPPRTPSTLNPQGPASARLAELTWVMLAIGGIIFLLVIGLMAAALLRGRRATSATPPDSSGGDIGRHWPIWGGIALPVVILAGVFGYSIYTLAAVESPQGQTPVHIQVVGRRWWWEVKYIDQGVTTANEIHLPVGVPVQIELLSADVIHSFWVPELNGKMDLVPTRINEITLKADQAGTYRGECAEYCGLQHAHMGFMVVAQSRSEFDAWLANQGQPAAAPQDPAAKQGQQVFTSSGCVFCHTVRGLEDKAIDRSGIDLGPDLTHLSSRLTIAGGYLNNNRGSLSGWVVDPQHIKPGVLMPNMAINSQDLQTLVAYLESLR